MTPDRLPPALRSVLDAELAAGNQIVDMGCTFPAPPVGGWVMLARALSTPTRPGLLYYERNGSQCFSELTDSQGHYWILTAPRAPEPLTSMDEIRERRLPKEPQSPPSPAPFNVRLDLRGEQIEYSEPGRSTWAVFTWWKSEPVLSASSVRAWSSVPAGTPVPMTENEIAQVVQRMADHLRDREGIGNLRIEW